VVDRDSGQPVVAAHVRVAGLRRTDFTHEDGGFRIPRVPAGRHTLVVERIGYATTEEEVEVLDGGVADVEIRLDRSAIQLPGMVVTATGREQRADQVYRPTGVLSGGDLQRALSSSLAETLKGEPGLALQRFGPAPAQPVIRGMSGDRVLVLEDGHRTGDLSHTAPDHAVGIDPITAERIEVVRGPAGLLYGSNALGGVVNMVRDEVPRTVPDGIHGHFTVQGQSVNQGLTGGSVVRLPLAETLAFRGEVTGRFGGDLRTPLGVLPSTDVQSYTLGAGMSWMPSWGLAGVAYRLYDLSHGLPGEFRGEAIPGAHENGALAETRRQAVRLEVEHQAGTGPFDAVELEANLVHYVHDEIEFTDAGSRVLGARFDQVTAGATLSGRHVHEGEGPRNEGAVGVSTQYRDLLTSGSFPGSRSATEHSLAVYGYEELGWGAVRFQAGLRYDHTWIEPHDTREIRVGDRSIPVRERTFGDISGSAALLWEMRPGWTVGTSVARAFRTPSVRELYSDGPHLADFSFDVGNPELDSETGLGNDLFLRMSRPRVEFEVSFFRNALDGYIYHAPTGELDDRFRRFPVFEARGDDAVFLGGDGRLRVEVVPDLLLDATVNYVRATRVSGVRDPLPAIPPLNGRIHARWEREVYFLSLGWDGARRQDRVPAPIPSPVEEGEFLVPERPTPGYGLVSGSVGFRWTEGSRLHSVTLRAENLMDREWRDHLSRIKDVAPEGGRNLVLLYRISF
jgi:iron complex outermembrane recepter protein